MSSQRLRPNNKCQSNAYWNSGINHQLIPVTFYSDAVLDFVYIFKFKILHFGITSFEHKKKKINLSITILKKKHVTFYKLRVVSS